MAPSVRRVEVKPPFAVGQVLALPVLGTFLDQLAARPDGSSPAATAVIAQLRDAPAADVDVPASLEADAPVVAHFATGLARLARAELDPAAQAFRASLRASSDFFPAMVYLGACFAAAGKDQEAAGAWQTALIKEGDVPALHVLLVDALLRLEKPGAALAALDRARARWPDDAALARRQVLAALAAGRQKEAFAALDALPAGPEDEAVLAVGLQVLYETIVAGQPVESREADLARLLRYADAYRRLGGPSGALVDAWVADATRR